MDCLTFVASLVESLAWPAVTLILAFALREHVSRLLGLVSKLRAGPIEAEFAREVQELQREVEPQAAQTSALADQRLRLAKLAQVSPRSAVIESWQLVEFATRDVLTKGGVEQLPSKAIESPLALGRLLTKHGGITPEDMDLYNQLRRLRNEAVHAKRFDPGEEATLNYINLSLSLYATIRALGLLVIEANKELARSRER